MDLLDEMKASHLPPNAVVYNSLISELARQGEVKKSFKLYNRMKKHGIVPTERTYSSLFAACSQAAPQGREQLDKLVKEISSKDIQLSLITLNAAIRALASHKNTPEALAMLDKMDEQYGIPPDVQSFTFALQACCQDQEDGASLAQIVWNDMESRGVKPDIYVYNEFIRAFRVAAYLTQSDTGYSSPLIPFGGIRATIKHMKRNKVKPDIRTFHELSGVVDGDGKAETELKVVMTDCHIKPDVLFMNAAIQRKAKTGSLDLAYSVYERMISEGLEPNVASVQALAHGCQTEKDAVRVLTTAMDSNIRPIESIFCSLLRVGARSHNYKYLISLIKLLDHYKIYPSEDIIAILDNIATEKPWEKKVKARKRFHFLQNKEGFRGYLKIWKHEHGYD
jgi:pentatricopeptide repeat protein